MSYPTGVIFACLAMALIVGMVYQAVSYSRGRQLISRRQFGLRMTTGLLLLLTIGLLFYTVATDFTNHVTEIICLALLMLLPVGVIVLAWLDLRQLARAQHQRQAELYKNLAELERDLKQKRPGSD